MSTGPWRMRRLTAPRPAILPRDFAAWLDALAVPTLIELPGRDPTRRRALCTLLHGNEPSGAKALFRWLQRGERPAVDTLCGIAAVPISLTAPRFTRRQLPGMRDLNRCFVPPFDQDHEGALAGAILAALEAFRPEALVDLHNTSGASPAYAITTRLDAPRQMLASGFVSQLIVTDLRLGTLMEATETLCPAITVECGQSWSPDADTLAYRGLYRYLTRDDLWAQEAPLSVLEHPLRVELAAGAHLAIASTPDPEADVTIDPRIERHNFGRIEAGTPLGWLGARGVDTLVARRRQQNITRALFAREAARLVTKVPLRLLMVTTRVDIARSDCLFYAVLDHAADAPRP